MKKRLLAILLAVCLVVSLAPSVLAANGTLSGSGTESEPYLIEDLADLKAFRDSVNSGNNYAGKTVKLTADIDLGSEEWTPIGTTNAPFNGTFDGCEKTISNLVINGGSDNDQGFFGRTNNGEIKNLTICNAKVSGALNVGVVAGTPFTSKYTDIKVTGHVEVNGSSYVGGVGGKNAYADWTDITVDVDTASYVKAVSTENGTAYRTYVGGVIGFNGEGGHTFKNISSNINVTGDVCDIGGIFGIIHYNNNVENVTCSAIVTNTNASGGKTETGGIAGVWHNQTGTAVEINNASFTGSVYINDVDVTNENSVVGGAYNPSNNAPDNSGSLLIDGDEAWIVVPASGTVTPAYSSATTIWGEATGNAKESFAIKLYSDETLLVTATLNDPNKQIIDGNIENVTWNIPINSAGNDEWWTIEWNTTLTAANLPTKVEAWVDGVKVAENTYKLNSPDDVAPVIAANTGADGSITAFISRVYNKDGSEALSSALAAGGNVVLLADLNLTSPITVSAGSVAVLDLNGKTVSGANNGTQYASMIHVSNGASLTIKDSSAAANGKLTYALETGAGAVVWVEGKLILESGTIELTGNKQGYAVDIRPNAWDHAYTEDTSFVVNGGAVVSSSVGVRVSYNSSNSFAANSVDFIMTDGSVTGSYAVYVDKQSAGAWNLGVAVEGGTLTATDESYPNAIYVRNTDAGNVSLDLSDGIYNGDIALYTNSTLNEANVTISGGTYNGDYGIANYDENKPKVITGGTFKRDVTDFCVEGYACQVNPDGTFGVVLDPEQSIFVAAIDGVGYTSLADAFKAATANCEIDILADVTISDTWDCRYNGAKFTVPVTIDGNGHTLKLTGAVDDKNWNTVFRFEADAVVKNLTIDASEATSIQRGISSKLSIIVEDCTLIGNGTSAKRAIIYGEGAGTSISDVTATISRCTFTNWTYGVSDNQNGQDAKSVTITGSTFNNASVLVSASENVVFTGNTLDNGYVNINSYTVPNELTVEATGNTLEDDYAEYNSIKAANITAQDDFVTPVAEVGGKYYTSLEEAVSKAGSSLVTIIRDIVLDEPITIEAGTASSIDLNGNTITGTIKLADGATLTAGEGLTVTTDVEGMIVTYENGIYSLAVGYTVTYTDGVDGKELFADQINVVAAGSPTPAFVGTPTRSGYTFAGWTPEVSATVTEDVTYTATWSYDYPDIVIPTTYSVTVKDSIGGEVDANRSYATAGTIVKLTVTPDDGYELDTLTVKTGSREISTTYQNGTYNFTMPYANVTVTATFKKVDAPDVSDECPGDWTCPMYGYTDLDRTAWYHDGIHFCIENDLMQGIGNNQFDPNSTTTRAMIVTILWRLEGSPVVNYAMDFEDVAAGQWYTEAIRWAASEKIVAGYGNGNFGTNDAITREQMVTIMYRYAQYKGYDVSVGENTNILSYDDAFDVAEWAIPAMQWACGSGMIQGIADGSAMNLAPQGNATRAQSAAILQRFCENVAEN